MNNRLPNLCFVSFSFGAIRSLLCTLSEDQQVLVLCYIGKIFVDRSAKMPIICLYGKREGEGKGGLVSRLSRLLYPIMTNVVSNIFNTGSLIQFAASAIVSVDEVAEVRDLRHGLLRVVGDRLHDSF
jgi:hypothetical protein